MLTLDNFEEQISREIVQRGRNYFQNDAVIYLDESGDNLWTAEVEGSETYQVEIELEGKKNIRVLSSSARLQTQTSDGTQITFTRSIAGGDPKVIECTISSRDGETQTTKLVTGYNTMADPIAGFQANLFKLLGWPQVKTVRTNGGVSNLYFENLAPLFLIEQLGGWTDIQAQQIHPLHIQETDSGRSWLAEWKVLPQAQPPLYRVPTQFLHEKKGRIGFRSKPKTFRF